MEVINAVIAALVCLFIANNNVMSRLLVENCGISKDDPYVPNIFGGAKTNIQENPWMVLVWSSKPCGGSLIARRMYLTKTLVILYLLYTNILIYLYYFRFII